MQNSSCSTLFLVIILTMLIFGKPFISPNLKTISASNYFNLASRPSRNQFSLFSLTDNSPSWKELDGILTSIEPIEERKDFENIKIGRGPSNSKATYRLFDAPDNFEPEVTLYRDSAAWCPFCAKVWLQLEEKRIPYIVDKRSSLQSYGGDKPQELLNIQPSGMLPVAIIKGQVISESNVIMKTIEESFPNNNPLLPPAGHPLESRVQDLLQLDNKIASIWFPWLQSSDDYSTAMDEILKTVDMELGKTASSSYGNGGPYFLGNEISLVDINLFPFLERMAATLPFYKGFIVRHHRYPNLLRWYEAMDSRETYRGIKSDYYTLSKVISNVRKCYNTSLAEPYMTEINGGAWDINVPPSECFEPMIPIDDNEARRDACRNIIDNYDSIVRFAARGFNATPGRKVVAPLADPYTIISLDHLPAIDVAMRHICHAMLEGPDAVVNKGLSSELPVQELKSCLSYLRDRIGVPRDMSVHGARQFRAHINWMISVNNGS
eukprot:gene4804-9580_t